MGFWGKWSANGGFSTSTLVYRRVIYRSICIPKSSNRITQQNCCPSQFIYVKIARSQLLIHTSDPEKTWRSSRQSRKETPAWNHPWGQLEVNLRSPAWTCHFLLVEPTSNLIYGHVRHVLQGSQQFTAAMIFGAPTLLRDLSAWQWLEVGWNRIIHKVGSGIRTQNCGTFSAEEPFRHLFPSVFPVEFSPGRSKCPKCPNTSVPIKIRAWGNRNQLGTT